MLKEPLWQCCHRCFRWVLLQGCLKVAEGDLSAESGQRPPGVAEELMPTLPGTERRGEAGGPGSGTEPGVFLHAAEKQSKT